MEQPETIEEICVIEQALDRKDLIIYNDDVNTFDHVIESLIKICKHEPEQAEQCTWIIHYKGKCQVRHGVYEELEPLCTALLNRGLSAQIE